MFKYINEPFMKRRCMENVQMPEILWHLTYNLFTKTANIVFSEANGIGHSRARAISVVDIQNIVFQHLAMYII